MRRYQDIQASLLRLASDFAAEHEGLTPLYLDNFTDPAQWPETDFVGVGEVHVDVVETYEVQCSFAISTRDDTNLHRMGQLVGELADWFIPNTAHPIRDALTGRQIAEFYVLNGTRIGPPLPTKTQPIQPLMVGFASNLRSALY